MFREIRVYEIKEILRLWVRGRGLRPIEAVTGVDRKTARRYLTAAVAAGLVREGGEEQITDELMARVCEAVRPHRPAGRGQAWEALTTHHEQLATWLTGEGSVTVVKAHELLARQGVVVPERTLHRYALERVGVGRSVRRTTVRVADGDPGVECQIDFGRMGLLYDSQTWRRRVCHALVVTACYSRHTFVWLTFRQTTEEVIAGLEAAWRFFGGVFKVVIPDNMGTIVDHADATEPKFNQTFIEYAQARGFEIDPARVRTPTDKPRVERTVPFVRNSFFAGETFIDRADAQCRAEAWCRVRAGLRIHGTTQRRPAEVFAAEEAPRLSAAPEGVYDVPLYSRPKVHRDHHIEVGKALYSVPGDLIGSHVDVRADRNLVRVYHRGVLIKVHVRQAPGGRLTDPKDLPAEKTAYALRDIAHLCRLAAAAGPAVGTYADTLADHPLPWTKMRQIYALLGLVKRWGAERVNAACARSLEAETVNVGLIGRMLERGTETATAELPRPGAACAGRFARDAAHFATTPRALAKSAAGGDIA